MNALAIEGPEAKFPTPLSEPFNRTIGRRVDKQTNKNTRNANANRETETDANCEVDLEQL